MNRHCPVCEIGWEGEAPERHSFGTSGICFFCRRSKQELINAAKRTLDLFDGAGHGQDQTP